MAKIITPVPSSDDEAAKERAQRAAEVKERERMATLRAFWRSSEGKARMAAEFDRVRGRALRAESK